jgi:hypothetical protein
MEKVGPKEQTPAELRLQVRSLVPVMIGIMESAADGVLATTTDPPVRAAALRFKAEGIPTMYRALFQPDPVAAFLDAWVLVAQMRGYLEAGPGRELPDAVRLGALGAVARMDAELARFARTLSQEKGAERARQWAEEFAAKHPIESFATRQSTEELLAAMTARPPLPLSASVDVLSRRLRTSLRASTS